MTSEQQLAMARNIRESVGPLRREDGTLDVSRVAAESTLRERYGVPDWIAELDAPNRAHAWSDDPVVTARYCLLCGKPLVPVGYGDWRGQLPVLRARLTCYAEPEDTTEAEELAAEANGDTMPAQGWSELPEGFKRSHPYCATLPPFADAGRFPAPREEHTMSALIAQAEIRYEFGPAADNAKDIDDLASIDPVKRTERLEQLSIQSLRELHTQAQTATQWHEQGARDARQLSRHIGQILRSEAEEIDPQNEMASGGVLR